MNESMVAERIEVTGVVQGVGFRPFVYRMATELGLHGLVGNSASRVFIEVGGPQAGVDEFARRLAADAPPLALVEHVQRSTLPGGLASENKTFSIVSSEQDRGARTHVPPDAATCGECLEEMRDPSNRRFGHPFITCTNCGPRFTIIVDLPYDRPFTTMKPFPMCADCAREYRDPRDRRYHAQPVSCHQCGPQLRFEALSHDPTQSNKTDQGDDASSPLIQARLAIASGAVIAIKGTGGFQLACDASSDEAVGLLRQRKQRPDKPFAVMVGDLVQARRLAEINEIEESQLRSSAAPIVLLKALASSPLSQQVAPGNPMIGIMLANNPVQHLLLTDSTPVLVMTSGNDSGTPIVFRDEDASGLDHLVDGLLTHDRGIHVPCDDSVVRVVNGELLPVRRARGYAPIPLNLPGVQRNVLAVGAELKNTFCLVSGRRPNDQDQHASSGQAWTSQHIGDMGNLETLTTFQALAEQFQSMYDVQLDPSTDLLVADQHPGYLSTGWAEKASASTGVPLLKVQHHHAHVCSVMAEHQVEPTTKVLGFAFDGTGYGSDDSIWGGEVLVATATDFVRVAHLSTASLPGNDAAARTPFRSAYAHLHASGIARSEDLPSVAGLAQTERDLLERQLESGFGCTETSSMGRLFDAVASLLGLRQHISFEAQAAIELETLALEAMGAQTDTRFAFAVVQSKNDDVLQIDPAPMLEHLVDEIRRGSDRAMLAWQFHRAVADVVVELARRMRDRVDNETVVLSGGVFQNALLTSLCVQSLTAAGFHPLTPRLVPANDGGLALGQAYIAAHSVTHSETASTSQETANSANPTSSANAAS